MVLHWPFNGGSYPDISTIYSDSEEDLNEVLNEMDNPNLPGLSIPLTVKEVKKLLKDLQQWLDKSPNATEQQLKDGGTFGL